MVREELPQRGRLCDKIALTATFTEKSFDYACSALEDRFNYHPFRRLRTQVLAPPLIFLMAIVSRAVQPSRGYYSRQRIKFRGYDIERIANLTFDDMEDEES